MKKSRSRQVDATLIATPHPRVLPRQTREPPQFGTIAKTCDNCQYFDPPTPTARNGDCRNGISGRFTTRRIDGCAYGFYPSITKFPLKAGPGGVR